MSPPLFDPDQSWRALERRMATEEDPRRLQLLTQVRDHMRTEITGLLDPLMDTLIDEPQYHFRGLVEGLGAQERSRGSLAHPLKLERNLLRDPLCESGTCPP